MTSSKSDLPLHPLTTLNRDTSETYRISLRTYPTGDAEVIAIKMSKDDHFRGGGATRKNHQKGQMDPETLAKSKARSKQMVKRKVLSIEATVLLTLTYHENQTDLDLAWKHFAAFNRKMKQRYADRWQYVCVPEYQKRGAVHFHLAIRDVYYHWNTVRRYWREAVGEFRGNVDFKKLKTKKGGYVKNPKKLGGYLAKYITKSEIVNFNSKRYSSSKIQLPIPVINWLALGVSLPQVIIQILQSVTKKRINSYIEIDSYYFIAKCET
jgi:hypothetical protein